MGLISEDKRRLRKPPVITPLSVPDVGHAVPEDESRSWHGRHPDMRRKSRMVRRNPVQSLTEEFIGGDLSRREFMKRAAAVGLITAGAGAGLGSQVGTAAAAAFTPERIAERAAAQVAEVPREETLVAVRSGPEGKYVGYNLWNPFLPAPGANHQYGSHMTSEPLAFYS